MTEFEELTAQIEALDAVLQTPDTTRELVAEQLERYLKQDQRGFVL